LYRQILGWSPTLPGKWSHRNRQQQRRENHPPIALNLKNALFAGHDAGAENWATIASLIETCKLNAVDPLVYLTTTLAAIVSGHKKSRIDELLPWNYPEK
jgi:hypothetical protein